MRRTRTRFTPAPLALAVALALSTPTIATAQATDPNKLVSISIAAQPLDSALKELSERLPGVSLAYNQTLVAGRVAQAVQGNLTPRQIIDRLLAGSGLIATGDGTSIVIKSATPEGGTDSTLPAMTVTAQGYQDGVTEGSHSYAASAATIGKGGARSLREIPQTVSVITRQQIEDQGLNTLEQVLVQAPGLYVEGNNGVNGGEYSSIYKARGFDVGYSIDGTASTNTTIQNAGQVSDVGILDRVEVLRGPAALLRGSETGNFGGMVNAVRKRPLPEFGVSTEISAGSWNNYRGTLDVTGPMNASNNIRGRAVLSANDRDYFFGPKSHGKNWTGYGVIEVDLTPNTTWTTFLSKTESRIDQPYTGVPRYSVDRILTTDRSFNQNREQGYSNVTDTMVSTEITHRFDNQWKITGKLNYQKYERESDGFYAIGQQFINPITNIAPRLYRLRHDIDSKTLSHDINVSGPLTLFGANHKITFGMDGSKLHYQQGSTIATYPNTSNIFDTAEQYPKLSPSANPSDRIYSQMGYYGAGQFKLADPLTLVVGARTSNFKYKLRTIGVNDWTTNLKETGEVTPYGGLIWDLNNQISLYASYADIFVPQSQVTFNGGTLPPRIGWQGEIGAKGEFFNGRLNGAIAFYRIRDTNRPMVDPDPTHIGCGTSPTSSCYTAAGLVQSQGVDLEISGSPLRGLQLIAGYTYNETEYIKDNTAANIGQKFDTLSPRHSLKLWGMYHFAASDFGGMLSGWQAGGGFTAQSETYSIWTNNRYSIPGRVVANAHIGWQVTPKTSLNLNINNLFDKEYLTGANGNYNVYGEPRNFTLTMRHQF